MSLIGAAGEPSPEAVQQRIDQALARVHSQVVQLDDARYAVGSSSPSIRVASAVLYHLTMAQTPLLCTEQG
jgi:hypothetical protein